MLGPGSASVGACAALGVKYFAMGGPPTAPHDLAVNVSATGGTLFADAACTTPLTTGSVTIAKGTDSVQFGFIPSAAGTCVIHANELEEGLTAQ
jgi:hypothetical protein